MPERQEPTSLRRPDGPAQEVHHDRVHVVIEFHVPVAAVVAPAATRPPPFLLGRQPSLDEQPLVRVDDLFAACPHLLRLGTIDALRREAVVAVLQDVDLHRVACIADFLDKGAIDIHVPDVVPLSDENESGLNINVYPNPSSGNFRVELSAERITKAKLNMINAAGELVWGTAEVGINRKQVVPVNIEALPEGMYLLKIETSTGISNVKIMINK